MDEKILVKSHKYKSDIKNVFKKIDNKRKIIMLVSSIPLIILLIRNIIEYGFYRTFIIFGAFLVIWFVILLVWFIILDSYEMTVTDKRIYGKARFGNRVDLPIDSVTAVYTSRMFNSVSVSTSSGKISFSHIKNADEIYSIINSLLIERQNLARVVSKSEIIVESKPDEVDKLIKYKNLLKQGVITQEEFDAKKKQILGL